MPAALPPPPLPSRQSVVALLADDAELADRLIALLQGEAPRLVESLEQAVAAGEREQVGRHAHTLRGMLAHFGATSACAAAGALEEACRAPERPPPLTPLAPLAAALGVEVARLLGALR